MVGPVKVVSLSVVVPATDSPPTLTRTTAAIAAAHDPPEEVVVVDGPPWLSAAGARNLGVERATGDVVVFVDADVEVHPDAFTKIRAAFAAHPQLAAVFGSYDHAPHARGWVSAFRNLLHHHVHQAEAGPATTFWTGLGAVRRSSFLTVRGFDADRYPHPSVEDIDFGHRLVASGGPVVLDPTILGTHLKVWTLRSMLWTDFARRGVPWVALQVRNRKLSAALNCGWRHRLSATVCSLAVVGVALRLPATALLAAVVLLGLNHRFYALLARQMGPVPAVVGVALHGMHHLVSVAAVPAGMAAALGTWVRSQLPRRPVPVDPPSEEGTSQPRGGRPVRVGPPSEHRTLVP